MIAALVKRVCDGENPVKVWGDGSVTLTLVFIRREDFARGLLDVAEKYPKADPLNIGADDEISVRELADMIVRLSGSRAKLGASILAQARGPAAPPLRRDEGAGADRIRGARRFAGGPREELIEPVSRP